METKSNIIMALIIICCIFLVSCGRKGDKEDAAYEYGVFLGIDNSDIDKLKDYATVVIDAEYFDRTDISEFKAQGKTVYTYINLGALENFRDYYEQYVNLALGDYEGWDEEKWVDVSENSWQEHILSLASEYADKGVDGYFIDNCDVYYFYPEENIYQGLVKIFKELKQYNKKIIVNGGDAFVTRYLAENGRITDILTGINQESVLTCNDEDTSEYYREYIAECKDNGAVVYDLEYTTDTAKIQEIKEFCKKNGYIYYIADSYELD